MAIRLESVGSTGTTGERETPGAMGDESKCQASPRTGWAREGGGGWQRCSQRGCSSCLSHLTSGHRGAQQGPCSGGAPVSAGSCGESDTISHRLLQPKGCKPRRLVAVDCGPHPRRVLFTRDGRDRGCWTQKVHRDTTCIHNPTHKSTHARLHMFIHKSTHI